MYICTYCGKECKNKNSLTQHEIRCKENENRIDLSYITKGHSKGHKGTNHFIKAKELGLDKPVVSICTRNKISLASKNRKHTKETKEKISKSIRKVILEHPESYCSSNVNGRAKHCIYKSIKLDSSWELIVAKYLDSLNINWIKNINSFNYIWNGKQHKYFPDFYLVDYNYYVEVKGYERKRDICKYDSVDNLIIIKANEIKQIQNNTYNIFNKIKKNMPE